MRRITLILLSLLLTQSLFAWSGFEKRRIYSPDKRLEATFSQNHNGPYYSLSFNGEEIIHEAPLGIVTDRWEMRGGEVHTCNAEYSSKDKTWKTVWGQYAKIRDNYNAMTITLLPLSDDDPDPVLLYIDVRLYNDGLALRYRIEGDEKAIADELDEKLDNDKIKILDEVTSFALCGDYDTFWIAGSYDDDEYAYVNTPLSGITLENMELSSKGDRKLPYPSVNTPVTMITPKGTHIAIHEAALWEYPAMSLRYDAESNTFTSDLASVGEVKSHNTLPFTSPWRVVIVGDSSGALMESTMILNLNEPCKLKKTSWIKPMKYVGVWWEMHLKESTWDMSSNVPHCATTENVCRYIDFAAENGFDGVLVEGWNIGWGWGERFDYTQPYPDFDIDHITDYARQRGVMLIGHHETYANVENYETQMCDAYDYYEAKGVGSVKTGYVGVIPNRLHNSREMVDHYNMTVTEAAKRHLSVDIHEPVHPTGISRTYPNLVSAEGMRGQEWQAWNSGNAIEHNTILPFTRNVAGPMDFTPGIFDVRYHNTVNSAAANEDNRVAEGYDYKFFVNSTIAHQLALYVVFYSPIQMVADLPDNYREHPDMLEFIREVAVDWSDTKVLDAKVGDYVVVARKERKGESWFIGGITDGEAREVVIDLSFLKRNKRYEATIYRDGDKAGWDSYPMDYVIEHKSVKADDSITLRMAEGGGFAISLKSTNKR